MSEGTDVIGGIIVYSLHVSPFKVMTGELIDWCLLAAHYRPYGGPRCEKGRTW